MTADFNADVIIPVFQPPLTYTIEQAARRVPCTERFIIDGLRERRFRGRKIMGQWRLTEDDLRYLVDACLVGERKAADTASSAAPTSRSRAHRTRGG